MDRRLQFSLCIHKRYPFCGQMPPPPHHPAPPGTSRQFRDTFIHKNTPVCGQKPPPNTPHPQKIPFLWTKAASNAASDAASASPPGTSRHLPKSPLHKKSRFLSGFFCDPSGARTQDPNIKSVVLYLLS